MGYVSFFENFIQIVVLLFAWVMVLLAFFILAIQLFVTLIEFKLTTLAGFVLIPFGLFGKTAFAAERVLGNVISSGVKVLVLAVIVGIGSTLFSQFTAGFGGAQPTIEDAMALVLAALALLGLGIFGPGIANGIVSGGPQLGAGAAVGTGLAAGGGRGGRSGPRCRRRRCTRRRGARGTAALAGGASGAFAGGRSCPASPDAGASADDERRFVAPRHAKQARLQLAALQPREAGAAASRRQVPSPPDSQSSSARRMKRTQTMSHGASAAANAVRSADHGGGAPPSISPKEGK